MLSKQPALIFQLTQQALANPPPYVIGLIEYHANPIHADGIFAD
jgi:hypothetical protein